MTITATSEAIAADLPPGYWLHETGAWCSIPWPTDPHEKRTLIESSLGPQIIDWAEGRTEIPGLIHHLTGQPWRFTGPLLNPGTSTRWRTRPLRRSPTSKPSSSLTFT